MKHLYQKNKQFLERNHINIQDHDACGVGFVASTNGKPRRDVVTNGINALKAVWHRGAVDADGKTGDGAGLNIEFNKDFFEDKIASTGHNIKEEQTLCIGMVFLPRNNFNEQERCRTLMEQELLKNNFFSRKIKIHIGKNYSPKIKSNDPLYDELKNFLTINNKTKINRFNNINFAMKILK